MAITWYRYILGGPRSGPRSPVGHNGVTSAGLTLVLASHVNVLQHLTAFVPDLPLLHLEQPSLHNSYTPDTSHERLLRHYCFRKRPNNDSSSGNNNNTCSFRLITHSYYLFTLSSRLPIDKPNVRQLLFPLPANSPAQKEL